MQAGDTDICIKNGMFDIVVGGVSVLGAMQEVSPHLKAVEAILGIVNVRKIDLLLPAICPNRTENGV